MNIEIQNIDPGVLKVSVKYINFVTCFKGMTCRQHNIFSQNTLTEMTHGISEYLSCSARNLAEDIIDATGLSFRVLCVLVLRSMTQTIQQTVIKTFSYVYVTYRWDHLTRVRYFFIDLYRPYRKV